MLTFSISFVVIAFVSLALSLISIRKRPEWINEAKTEIEWKRIVLRWNTAPTLIIGAVLSFFISYNNLDIESAIAFSSVMTSFVFIIIQSLYTDLKFRSVDRRLFYAALIIATLANILYVTHKINLGFYENYNIIAALILLIFATLILFFMESIGSSDARALQLVAIGIIPLIGFNGFAWGMVLLTGLLLLVGIVFIFLKKKIKVSVPAVPIIMIPFFAISVYGLFEVIPQLSF